MTHHDPLDQQIAHTLNTVAAQVPVRDRLAEFDTDAAAPNSRRWRFAEMPALAGAVAFVVGLALVGGVLLTLRNNTNEPSGPAFPVVTTATTTTTTTKEEVTLQAIEGIWLLESFSIAGDKQSVEIGVNTQRQPWVEIGESRFAGSFGCNRFDTANREPPTLAAGLLNPGEVASTLALCGGGEGAEGVMAVENVFSEMIFDETRNITVSTADDAMTWSAGDTVLSFVRGDERSIPTTTDGISTTVTTSTPEPVLDVRTPSGVPGDALVVCGLHAGPSEVRVVMSDPVSGDAWPDDVDEFVEPDERGSWCWRGEFPDQLRVVDSQTEGALRPMIPGVYEIRVESYGDVVLSASVEVRPGHFLDDGPSQTAETAARDGVVSGLAEWSMAERVEAEVYTATPEGIWVLSSPMRTEGRLVAGDHPTIDGGLCVPDNPECFYGVDYIYSGSYGELLLMDQTGREILRAYPMPDVAPGWLYVDDDYTYAGHIGDGASPHNTVVRVNRSSLEMVGLIFEHPDNEYAFFADVEAKGQWLDHWQVVTDYPLDEWPVALGANTIGGAAALSDITDVYIDLEAVASLFGGSR